MRKFSTISKAASAVILGSVLFVGCGSSSSSSSSSTSTVISGAAIDGYLENSTMTYNGVIQNGSGIDGAFSFVNSEANASVVQTITVSSGIDKSNGALFKLPLKAIFTGSTGQTVNVSPLTTLVANAFEHNASRFNNSEVNATASIAAALGITATTLNSDFIASGDAAANKIVKQIVGSLNIFENNAVLNMTQVDLSQMFGNIAISMVDGLLTDDNLTAALGVDLVNPQTNRLARLLPGAVDAFTDTKNKVIFLNEFFNTLSDDDFKDSFRLVAMDKVLKDILDAAPGADIDDNATHMRENAAIYKAADTYAKTTGDVIDFQALFTKTYAELKVIETAMDDGNASTIFNTIFVSKETLSAGQDILIINAAKAIDTLKLKGNSVTIGDTTVSFANGRFDSTITNEPVSSANIGSLYNVEFDLEDITAKVLDVDSEYYSLENGDDHNITLGVEIKDTVSNNSVFVTLDTVNLTRSGTLDTNESTNYNGDYSISTVNSKLYATVTQGTTTKNSTSTGIALSSSSVTASADKFNVSLENIITQLKTDTTIAANVTDIEAEFAKAGNYEVNLFVSSDTISGLSSSAPASVTDLTNTNKAALFTGSIFKIGGSVVIAANDKLAFASDQVTLGKGDQAKTITISNGTFTTSHKPVTSGNVGDIYNVAFTLANIMDGTDISTASVEDGDVHNLTLKLKIEDKTAPATGSKRMISVEMNGLELSRSATSPDTNTSNYNGEYTIEAKVGAQLIANATKSDGTPLSSTMTNSTSESYITTSNGVVNVDMENLITEFEGKLSGTATALKDYFGTEGEYVVTLDLVSDSISGVEEAVSSATNTFSIIGAVSISNNPSPVLTGVPASAVTLSMGGTKTQALTLAATDVDANGAATTGVVITTSSSNEAVATVSNTLVTAVAKGTTTISVTATDTQGGTTVETFNVTVENSAPVVAEIADKTATQNSAMTSITVSATDADSDTLTYSATELPSGVDINSTTGVISGTPTSSGTATVTVSVTDGTATEHEGFDIVVAVDPDAASVPTAATAEIIISDTSGDNAVSNVTATKVTSASDGIKVNFVPVAGDPTNSSAIIAVKIGNDVVATISPDDAYNGAVFYVTYNGNVNEATYNKDATGGEVELVLQ